MKTEPDLAHRRLGTRTENAGAPAFEIRAAGADDAALIARHRTCMYLEAGFDRAAVRSMNEASQAWIAESQSTHSYVGLIAERERQPIGGIGIMIHAWPPHPHHPADARRGYILNLFVEPAHRGVGVGAALVAEAQHRLRAAGVAYASLHPTEPATPLYRRLGWSETGEMAKRL